MAELFQHTAEGLHLHALRLNQGDPASAEDLVQEVFQAAALAWATLRCLDSDRRRAWLFRVLQNKSIDRWRSSACDAPLADMVVSTAAEDTYHRAIHSILLERCWKLLRSMPTARFRVAYLTWHEDMTTGEIAEHLGIAPTTVRVHRKHARDEIIETIGPDVPFLGCAGEEEE
ncbi:RNA polymerase sigma factor [Actinokineospora inagensis]|uniref:RNA polymerase sigma factor n=1 Tax=Actinokineospora inagensis TaxID=103730 RepID=UPI00146FA7FF|nr:sigma-70 family RNA polymerase sigma factor [Actinokineospora inagensis]